jgi:hypothetical protein
MAKCAQRQHPLVFSPRLRQYGGCSPVSRRQTRHKILNLAAVHLLPADHIGSNYVNYVTIMNLVISPLGLIFFWKLATDHWQLHRFAFSHFAY